MGTTELTLTTLHEGLKVTIYDSQNRVVSDEYVPARQTKQLPNGIYTIRAELSGQWDDQTLLLRGQPVEHNIKLLYYSATPLDGIETSHEYYTHNAHRLSLNPTRTDELAGKIQANSGLLIFLRCTSKEQYQQYYKEEGDYMSCLISYFFVLDEAGIEVARPTDWEHDETVGWLGFSARFRPGLYHLVYCPLANRNECRQIPLYIFETWQTQVFITLGSKPLFASMRLQMAPIWLGLTNQNGEAYAVDFATDRLQNHRYNFPETILNTLRSNSRTNPILGILWSYSYLLDDTNLNYLPDETETVLNWLKHTIPETWPDLQVLRALANKRLGLSVVSEPVEKPSMLSVGMEQLIRMAAEHSDLVIEGSLTDQIATELYLDSVWTSWHPEDALINGLLSLSKNPVAPYLPSVSSTPNEVQINTAEPVVSRSIAPKSRKYLYLSIILIITFCTFYFSEIWGPSAPIVYLDEVHENNIILDTMVAGFDDVRTREKLAYKPTSIHDDTKVLIDSMITLADTMSAGTMLADTDHRLNYFDTIKIYKRAPESSKANEKRAKVQSEFFSSNSSTWLILAIILLLGLSGYLILVYRRSHRIIGSALASNEELVITQSEGEKISEKRQVASPAEIILVKSVDRDGQVTLHELATQLSLPYNSTKRIVKGLLDNDHLRTQLVADLHERKLITLSESQVLAALTKLT